MLMKNKGLGFLCFLVWDEDESLQYICWGEGGRKIRNRPFQQQLIASWPPRGIIPHKILCKK